MTSVGRRLGLVAGPVTAGGGLLLGPPQGMTADAWAVAMVAVLMAVWWISEAIPLAATALVPVLAFPALDVMPAAEVTRAYGHHLIFLFIGGFFIAVTMQRWDLHRRIALHTIVLVGTDPRRMILGFMVATGGLSMWISNTATAMMMLPIGLAVLRQSQDEAASAGQSLPRGFGVALMLGIAYSASIGGMATLIGTPPNAVLAGMAEQLHGISIDFATWMAFGLPLSVLFLALTWAYLAFGRHGRGLQALPGGRERVREELRSLGGMDSAEARVLVVFVTEVTSNTATATVFVPLMGAIAVATGFHPLVLMAAVAVAASCAFMLPVATPPNAVVFGSRAITIPDMARAGLVLNLVTIVLTTLFVYLLLPVVMGLEIVQP